MTQWPELKPLWLALHQLHPAWRESFSLFLHRHMMENTAPLEGPAGSQPIIDEALTAWLDAYASGDEEAISPPSKTPKRRTVILEK